MSSPAAEPRQVQPELRMEKRRHALRHAAHDLDERGFLGDTLGGLLGNVGKILGAPGSSHSACRVRNAALARQLTLCTSSYVCCARTRAEPGSGAELIAGAVAAVEWRWWWTELQRRVELGRQQRWQQQRRPEQR
jgi:hypothetical protein